MVERVDRVTPDKSFARLPGKSGNPFIKGYPTDPAYPDRPIGASRQGGTEQRALSDRKAPEARPIVKWVGGKTRLLPELLKRVPQRFGRYYEPFAGGAALFFALAPERAVLSDANADLMAMYRAVARDSARVVALLELHAAWHSEAHYAEVRDAFNARGMNAQHRAAALLYLNRVCFNGLWRVNADGAFNVPMGSYKNPRICDAGAIEAASRVLARAALRSGSYELAVVDAVAGDFVYLDPPYDETFTSYTSDAFSRDDQRTLAATARVLVDRGVHVMLSNSDTPFVRELYSSFTVERVKNARSVNADATGRGHVHELLITGGHYCPRPRRNRMSKSNAMPKDQMFLDDSMKPPPDPADLDIPEVRKKIYAALDLKYEHAQLGERMKAAFDAAMLSLREHGIEQHPYIDRKTGKKRFFVADTTPKPKTMAVPRRRSDDDDDEYGPDDALEDKLADKESAKDETADVVEKRTVSRASVESEIDPFAATRAAMEDLGEKPAGIHDLDAGEGAKSAVASSDPDPVVTTGDGKKRSVPRRKAKE